MLECETEILYISAKKDKALPAKGTFLGEKAMFPIFFQFSFKPPALFLVLRD